MKLSIISILLSLICLIVIMIINYGIYIDYMQSTGKTRALFGLVEWKYSYKYLYAIIGTTGLIISLFAIRKKENRFIALIAVILSAIALISLFIRYWKWFI